ncbi:MAG: pyridoxal-phosphate dependent enzyme [Chloroflexi bacterium]|nr:pyridoxal-phosphate dependent enzyme [Chloroflexota bacterium]
MPVQIHDNILGTLGGTPLVRLNKVARSIPAEIVGKVEFFNPGGSVKDRIGIQIIEDAEREGRLRPGGTIVEATSGNTGIGLAIAAAIKGYKCVFVLADKQSPEKIQILRAFGARVIVTPTNVEPEDPRSYYSVARRVVEETPGAILANQYHNPSNPKAHELTTGPEIWEQTGGDVHAVVMGMGTGGTVTGVARYLKSKNPNIQIVGVDPVGSILYHHFKTGGEMTEAHSYLVEGIGEDFIPSTYEFSLVDDVVQVSDKESFLMTRRLVREEGIFCGVSCGSAVAGALRYARAAKLTRGQRVVVILPDSGYRYLGKVFNDEWMRENRFLDPVWVGASVETLLDRRPPQQLIVAQCSDSIGSVIAKLREHSISQVPVVNAERQLLGLVSEVNLLSFLLKQNGAGGMEVSLEDSGVIETDPPSAELDTPLDVLMATLTGSRNVVIVKAGDEVRDIITKIDLIDFISGASR